MLRRLLLRALVASSVAGGAAAADPVVVELFTSQGCSSCPPADAILGTLADRDDVIALSFHVDYWDWIGWADTFGAAAHTERQRSYAHAAGTTVLYTPQFVIGGAAQVAGADGMAVAEAVAARAAASGEVIGLDGAGRLTLAPTGRAARLMLAEVAPEATVAIEHGENAGHALTYRNVVRGWRELGAWDGAAATVEAPAAVPGRIRVVLAQAVDAEGLPGPVLGAIRLD